MTYDEAKNKLDEYVEIMKSERSFVSYAAIIIDTEDNTNYWLEVGLSVFSTAFIIKDKILNANQKGTFANDNSVTVSEDGTLRNLENFKKTTQAYGNLLSETGKIKEQIRPLKAGTSIADKSSKSKSGTIGVLFTVKEDEEHTYLLSNMHVLSYFKESDNLLHVSNDHDYIVQPSRADASDLHYNDEGSIIGYTVWKKFDGLVDAAVARINPAIPLGNGFFNGHLKSWDYPESVIEIGQAVHKYGRTTGFTEGEILSIDAAVRVQNLYPEINGLGEFMVFKDQIMTSNMAEDGDSGSLLIGTAHKYPIGLTFADINFKQMFPFPFVRTLNGQDKGRTFHNKLSNVFTSMSQNPETHSNNQKLTLKSLLTKLT